MIANGNPTVDLQYILSQVAETDILNYYIGVESLPTVINSPLRKDNKPSFGLVLADNYKVRYTDYSTGEKGGLFNLLENLWKLPFKDVIIKIYEDLPQILSKASGICKGNYIAYNKSISYHDGTQLKVAIRSWKSHDLDYWKLYGISLEWLKFGKVFPISHIFVEKDGKEFVIPAEKYAYVYVENKDNVISIKIYQPYSDFFKWRSQHDSSTWDLWRQLPQKGNNLIITSSRKDALTLWENTLIPSCSLQTENSLPKVQVIEHLKSRFKRIFVLYDNDFNKEKNWGRIYGNRLSAEFGLKQIEIPENYKSKDPSDLHKNHGKTVLVKTIFKLIN